MASFLLSECLEIIFSKLTEYPSSDIKANVPTKDLYSCTLVSRHWCRISTPLLYAYPFHHFRYNYSRKRYYKLIRTLLNCFSQFNVNALLQIPHNDHKDKISKISSTFNYIPFIRGLIFNKFMFKTKFLYNKYKRIWLTEYDYKNISETSTISIMKDLIKFICKYCNNLTTFEFSFLLNDDDDIIKLLTFKDHNGKSKLSNLKELYHPRHILNSGNLMNNYYLFPSNDVYNLNVLYVCKGVFNSDSKVISLSKFISSQKMLQHFILSGTIKYEHKHKIDRDEALADNYNKLYIDRDSSFIINIINSLSTQSESLQILEFIDLENTSINLSSLQLLKNIRKLKLNNCRIDNLHFWLMELKNLEIFEVVMYGITESILIQLIKSISSDLTKLVIYDDRELSDYTELYKQITLYLNSLTHLELPQIFAFELISIFKSYTKLVCLSVILLLSKDSVILNRLGESVPKTLERIRFRKLIGTSHISITFKSLEIFIEACANNNSSLKYVEFECKNLKYHDDNNVTEQYGVKILKYCK
jgi:hypothetical protein